MLDALILIGGRPREANWEEVKERGLTGCDVLIVQAKLGRLGMYLMGQAFFSRELIKMMTAERRWKPKSIQTIALCEHEDDKLGAMLRKHGIDLVCPKKGKFLVVN